MNYDCDVVIVGSGAAGLYCALHLPSSLRVQLITKQKAEDSDSFLAQGGICVLRGEEDYESFYADTLRAGHGENNPKAVDQMIRFSNTVIDDLVSLGVHFEQNEDGSFRYTREGAHSCQRILYHQDITGAQITETLLRAVRRRANIQIREQVSMLDLLSKDNVCGGLVIADEAGRCSLLRAPIVVLCCGGLGGLYDHTTNYPHISGDALAIALRHAITLQNMDYIQIHPTTFYTKEAGRRFLISESVRGEGAYLLGKDGKRFTDELLPRDKLTQEIWKQMEKDGMPHVWEDMRHIGEETILSHFPNIHQHCLDQGIDVRKDLIPVVPAQHYFMGGVKVDLASRSSMQGLYACGETSCNGVHGRNRLASNSLLESLVFSLRAAQDIAYASPQEGPGLLQTDLAPYANQAALKEEYRCAVLNEIERMKACHE